MGGRRHRVQLFLFLAALAVPCVVLIGLGVRIVKDNRGLRTLERRRHAAEQTAGKLLEALESIASTEIRTDLEPGQRYRHSEVAFIGWVEEDGLALPWEPERDRAAGESRRLFSLPGFAAAIHACDQAKSGHASLSSLNACYERASAAAEHPAQAAYARWLWANDLSEAGRTRQAEDLFSSLLGVDPEITDEGVPLRLLAAQWLARTETQRRAAAASAEAAIAARPWLPLMAAYVANNIAEQLARGAKTADETAAAQNLGKRAAAHSRLLLQADELQNDFPRILPLLRSRPGHRWAGYGEDLWLVGTAGNGGPAAPVFVVRGQDVLQKLAIPGALRLAGAEDPQGERLGESLPGLKVVLADDRLEAARDFQRSVLYFALLLVMAATAFGAYLLWRDLRREMRLSELRAQFVSSVSHELKTPLTAIRMFAETLQMGRCADPDTQAEYLGTIVNESERLSRLVDGVLQFSKAEQGKRTYRFRPMQAADAVTAAARAMEYPLSQHGFRLRIDLQDGLPPISGDRDAVEQAVLNLLSNAMKYSGDARDVELALAGENGEVTVRVTDHGIGIAPEEQSRIFEKFYRAPSPENQLIPGAGLGLALVAQIVKAHGGRVEVESAPGKGSAFSLHFPAL
ncbi:MAG: HAMP domain-containing histidine kinase [Acidobacteriia bacterium]|nr:HAMP domain-containing histidine kinase [Terriglobia bacterium]